LREPLRLSSLREFFARCAISDEREPEHDSSGFFNGGPKAVNPSDLLGKLIGYGHCGEEAPEPREPRRKMRLYSAREAAAQRGRKVRPWEC
jgi:hypothetical protein